MKYIVLEKSHVKRFVRQRKGRLEIVGEHERKAISVPKVLSGLAGEAMKCSTFEDFERAFLGQIKHGTYWHFTDDPNFRIDPKKGPRDMSSMASGKMDVGSLMITSNFDAWAEYGPGGKHRKYVALIDMSGVKPEHYKQVNRGFGNEFFVSDPSKAKVEKVYNYDQARRVDQIRANALPQSREALKELYDKVKKGL